MERPPSDPELKGRGDWDADEEITVGVEAERAADGDAKPDSNRGFAEPPRPPTARSVDRRGHPGVIGRSCRASAQPS
jgi:hypothetical protein